MAQSLASLALPAPPSWYPGHMRQFVRTLPALLSRTDVVLELRDARLPLTSINGTFEGKFSHPFSLRLFHLSRYPICFRAPALFLSMRWKTSREIPSSHPLIQYASFDGHR